MYLVFKMMLGKLLEKCLINNVYFRFVIGFKELFVYEV